MHKIITFTKRQVHDEAKRAKLIRRAAELGSPGVYENAMTVAIVTDSESQFKAIRSYMKDEFGIKNCRTLKRTPGV